MKVWIIYGLLALLAGGAGNFLMRFASLQGLSAQAIITTIFLTNLLFGLGIWLFCKPDLTASPKGLASAIVAGLMLGVATLCLNFAFSQPDAKTGIATALLNANFALVTVLSYYLLSESLSTQQIIGLFTVLIGIILLI